MEYFLVNDYNSETMDIRGKFIDFINNNKFIKNNFSEKNPLNLHYIHCEGLIMSFSFKKKNLGDFYIFVSRAPSCPHEAKEIYIHKVFNEIIKTIEAKFKKHFKETK